MNLEEFLQTILFIVATAILPVVANYVSTYLKVKKEILLEDFDNVKLREYANDAVDCVLDAVVAVNQTFVDTLKQSGNFTPDAQKEAFKKAKIKAIELISEESKNAIAVLYSDFDKWLDNQIEVCVNQNKNGVATLRA